MALSDDSDESISAARFAAMRAKIVGAGLVILRITDESGFGHWPGLDKKMRREAKDNAQQKAQELAKDIQVRYDIEAEIIVGEKSTADAIRTAAATDQTIKVLVIGSGTDGRPGPLVSHLGRGKPLADRPLAVTIVPGALTDAELAEMGGMHV